MKFFFPQILCHFWQRFSASHGIQAVDAEHVHFVRGKKPFTALQMLCLASLFRTRQPPDGGAEGSVVTSVGDFLPGNLYIISIMG